MRHVFVGVKVASHVHRVTDTQFIYPSC